MADLSTYSSTKAEALQFIEGLTQRELRQTCLACPAWSLQDVLAHHIHAVQTLVADNALPRAAGQAIFEPEPTARRRAIADRDEWTEAGVSARRGMPLADLIAEWAEVELMMTEQDALLIVDLSVHYDDIRETIEGRQARYGPDLMQSLEIFHQYQSNRLGNYKQTPVRLRCIENSVDIGDAAQPVVTGGVYELVRCITSRRTRRDADHVLEWGSARKEQRQLFPVYGWPEDQM